MTLAATTLQESPVSACLEKEGVSSRDKALLPTGVQSDSHFCQLATGMAKPGSHRGFPGTAFPQKKT